MLAVKDGDARTPGFPCPIAPLTGRAAQLLDAGGHVAGLLLVALADHDFHGELGKQLSLRLVALVARRPSGSRSKPAGLIDGLLRITA